MRVIFVPQYPAPMRYQEWWIWKFPKEFRKAGYEVIVLGKKYIDSNKPVKQKLAMFSSINNAIDFEAEQIKEYMKLDIRNDDILFVSDLSFPGLFCNVLYHKQCPKMFCFCHATSINYRDYFESKRKSKFMNETSHAILFNKIFIGSNYHKRKLLKADKLKLFWNKLIVTYLPYPPLLPTYQKPKKYNIISVSRPTPQKVDDTIENRIEETFGPIYRPQSNTWKDYFNNLNQSKILLITAKEETFGLQIIDAVINGCIPLARCNFSYPELLPPEYLYNSTYDLVNKISYFLYNRNGKVPYILCEKEMHNFYNKIIIEIEKTKSR